MINNHLKKIIRVDFKEKRYVNWFYQPTLRLMKMSTLKCFCDFLKIEILYSTTRFNLSSYTIKPL